MTYHCLAITASTQNPLHNVRDREVHDAQEDCHQHCDNEDDDGGGVGLLASREVDLFQLRPHLAEEIDRSQASVAYFSPLFLYRHGSTVDATGQAGLEPATPGFGVRCSAN